jgi:hypothetical protein
MANTEAKATRADVGQDENILVNTSSVAITTNASFIRPIGSEKVIISISYLQENRIASGRITKLFTRAARNTPAACSTNFSPDESK